MKVYIAKYGVQYICDFCGEVVSGQVKAAEVHKRYIQFKLAHGSVISIQDWDEETAQRKYCFVTQKPDPTNPKDVELTFCDPAEKSCFVDFLQTKEKQFNESKINMLREEANRGGVWRCSSRSSLRWPELLQG